MNKSIESKLRKLLILSERGVDGEKENDADMLHKLLDKHDLTLNDISDEAKEIFWFKYKGKFQEQLLHQIIVATAGRGVECWTQKRKRTVFGATVTKYQMIEIEMLFDAYKIALEEELNFSLDAFINKNNIFPEPDRSEKDRQCTDEEIRRAKLIAERMLYMEKVTIQKQLKGGKNG